MSASQLSCLQCGSPILFPPGQSSHFQCAKCGTAFDLIPQTADPTTIVEAIPVMDGPFGPVPEPPAPAPRPASVPVIMLPQVGSMPVVMLPPEPVVAPQPARGARDEEDDEDDRPVRRRRARDEDDGDDRGPARREPKKRTDSGAKVAVIVCAAAVLLLVAAVGGYFAFSSSSRDKEVAKKDAPPPPKKDAIKKDDGPLTTDQLLRKVKPSTVYIRALNRDGSGGTGTGFFAGKPGHVVTNAHVVGYKLGDIRKPSKLEVVIDSGEAGERVVTAEIYGLDILLDLAVLKVDPLGMPPPLKFGKAEALRETQDVVAFGYPFGETLGKGVTVSSTKVSSLRRERGTLETIQLAGGLNPGNSGGPVTNTNGEVIGVSVSKFRGAEIAFAIPAETAKDFLEDMLNNGGAIRTGGLELPVRPEPPVAPPAPRATGWAPLRIPPPRAVAFAPTAIDGDRVELKPPGVIGGACVAGGGRFIVFHLRDDNKLAIFDVTAAKIVKTIPVPEKVLFAAGADALVVVDAEEDTVERWSLATFAKEATADLPVTMGLSATAVAMGSSSNGPLMVQALDFPRLGERFLFDVTTMKEVDGSRTHRGELAVRPGDELRASADGRTFTQWNPEGQSVVIAVTDTGYHEAAFPAQVPGTASVPGGDGQSVYALEEIAGRGGARSGRASGKGGAHVPAAHGPLFLALPRAGSGGKLAVHAGRDRKPLLELPVPEALEKVLDRDKVPLIDRHVFFIPAARALVVLSPDRDAVTLHKFDVGALLEKADDYLYVASAPPQAFAGKAFAYQLVVKSKKPLTGFKLVFGPPDMTVSDTGRVSCEIPPAARKSGTVVVAILDADGKAHRHEFELVPTVPPPE